MVRIIVGRSIGEEGQRPPRGVVMATQRRRVSAAEDATPRAHDGMRHDDVHATTDKQGVHAASRGITGLIVAAVAFCVVVCIVARVGDQHVELDIVKRIQTIEWADDAMVAITEVGDASAIMTYIAPVLLWNDLATDASRFVPLLVCTRIGTVRCLVIA